MISIKIDPKGIIEAVTGKKLGPETGTVSQEQTPVQSQEQTQNAGQQEGLGIESEPLYKASIDPIREDLDAVWKDWNNLLELLR